MNKLFVSFFFCLLYSCINVSSDKSDNQRDSLETSVICSPRLNYYIIYDSVVNGNNREINAYVNYKKDSFELIIKGYSESAEKIDSNFFIRDICLYKIFPNNHRKEIKIEKEKITKYQRFRIDDLTIRDYSNCRLDSLLGSDIVFIDYNLDGFPEMNIFYTSGTGGSFYYTWLYKPEKNEYIIDTLLSQCNIDKIDLKNKNITLWWHNGFESYNYNIYKIENGKFILIKEIHTYPVMDSAGNYLETKYDTIIY